MKKVVFYFSLLLLISLCVTTSVKAATREELLQYMPEEYLNSLSEEQYKKVLTLDVSRAVRSEEVYKTSKYPEEISPLGDEYWETTYKKITLTAIPYQGTVVYSVMLDTVWKYNPTVRSFDVSALRFENLNYDKGIAGGTQMYTLKSTGKTTGISYSPDGTNIKKEDDGFGISMNLVNDAITYIRCYISVDASMSTKTGTIYGSYQHAVDNVSLAQSQDYTIDQVGMGRVINFSTKVWNHYDDMDGVKVTLTK